MRRVAMLRAMADEVMQRLKREAMRDGPQRFVLKLLDPDGEDNLLASLDPDARARLKRMLEFVELTTGAERWRVETAEVEGAAGRRTIRLGAVVVRDAQTQDAEKREHVLRQNQDDPSYARVVAIMRAAGVATQPYAWRGEELLVRQWGDARLLQSDRTISFGPGSFAAYEKLSPAIRQALREEAALAPAPRTPALRPATARRPKCEAPECTNPVMGPGTRHCALHSSSDLEDEELEA